MTLSIAFTSLLSLLQLVLTVQSDSLGIPCHGRGNKAKALTWRADPSNQLTIQPPNDLTIQPLNDLNAELEIPSLIGPTGMVRLFCFCQHLLTYIVGPQNHK